MLKKEIIKHIYEMDKIFVNRKILNYSVIPYLNKLKYKNKTELLELYCWYNKIYVLNIKIIGKI